ncbi:creatininase family protein [Thioclava electrotropha]|uniref:Creatininase family protein n=1 Tax=Thioclava electrotropha TaxID=1549850 RepID=A0ABX6YYN0_9RHOB|nr:creatininase family protein [Thioclava electrotropha]QPZ92384.1 creatininase family protein [Thioclava electrotropha]
MTADYGKLTWEQVRDADKDRVVILNVSATEDHGPHMPLDTDTVLGMAVANGVAEAAPDEVFVMPAIPYGFNEHHKDFPGVIWIQPETLINFVCDVTESLAHHGFRRILLLNSHGSNHPILDLAARKTVIRTGIICVSASYWNLCSDRIQGLRKSEVGGIAHAGEFEAAMYKHLHPELVDLDKAECQNLHDPDTKFFNLDLAAGGGKAMLMRWWSSVSPDGTMGDPTVADAETGKAFLEAAIEETTALVREMRALPILSRRDHH